MGVVMCMTWRPHLGDMVDQVHYPYPFKYRGVALSGNYHTSCRGLRIIYGT